MCFCARLNEITFSEIRLFNPTEKTLSVYLSKSKKPSAYNTQWDRDAENFCFIRETLTLNPQQEQFVHISFHSKFHGSFKCQIDVFVNEELWKSIDLIAFAYVADLAVKEREAITTTLAQANMAHYFREIIDDLLAEVKTSPPPLPDLTVREVRKSE